jgi:hypothetical protein
MRRPVTSYSHHYPARSLPWIGTFPVVWTNGRRSRALGIHIGRHFLCIYRDKGRR